MSNYQTDREYADMERSHAGPERPPCHGLEYYQELEKRKEYEKTRKPHEYKSSDNSFDFKGMKRSVTGGPDTGSPDTGSPDTGSPDTGSPDAGSPDTGSPDTGSPDTGSPDAGSPDAGPIIFKGFHVVHGQIVGNGHINANGISIDHSNFSNVNENTEFSLWKKETENGYKLIPLSSPNLNFEYMYATWSLENDFHIIVNN